MVVDLLMDPGINVAFQSFSPPVTAFFSRGEFLDSMPWYFLIISLVSFGLHPRYGVRLATLFGLNAGLNEAVKLFCHLPRPYWVAETVRAFSAHSSFGFPSGAAMSGMVIYGYIATLVRQYRIWILCIVLFLATSLVRIMAGIHFLLDILGGWILGLALLLTFLAAAPRAEAFALRVSRPARICLYAGTAAIPLILAIPAFLSLGSWPVPADWSALALQQTGSAIHPDRIQFAWGAAGIIFGSLCGYEFLASRGGWEPPRETKLRAGIVVAGTASVLILNALLPLFWITLGITPVIPQLAAFLNMAGVSAWLMAGVPTLATRAGLR